MLYSPVDTFLPPAQWNAFLSHIAIAENAAAEHFALIADELESLGHRDASLRYREFTREEQGHYQSVSRAYREFIPPPTRFRELLVGRRAIVDTSLVERMAVAHFVHETAALAFLGQMVAGTIGMINAMAMSVAERVGEIGMLRAIGWRKRRVVSIILCESVLLSIAAAIVGTLAAIALTDFLSTLPRTSGVIQEGIAPSAILEGLLVALLAGLGGAIYPALWAAGLAPQEAMRRK